MKRVTELNSYINDRLRIDEKGGRLSIDQFNRVLALSVGTYYDNLINMYEASLAITNLLNPFIGVQVGNITGELTPPADYYKTSLLERQSNGQFRRLDLMTNEEWGARMADSTSPPSELDPMARMIGGKIMVLPATSIVNHYYFKKLITPYLAKKVVGEDVVVDDTASVELPFTDDTSFNAIANIILTKSGISLGDQAVAQTAAQGL